MIFFCTFDYMQALKSVESLYLNGNPDFDASSLLQQGRLPSLNTLQLAGSAQTSLSKLPLRKARIFFSNEREQSELSFKM